MSFPSSALGFPITVKQTGPLLALISLILLAGGIVLQFFVVLSGATYGTPENLVYFLRADTSTITGAPAESAWNFLALCGYGTNVQSCKGTQAALPFQPDQNFGTTTGVPPQFLGYTAKDTRKPLHC